MPLGKAKRPLTALTANMGSGGLPPVALPIGAVIANPSTGNAPPRKADPRFRSFVERYVIERAAYFRQDPDGLAEDQWRAVQDGKRLYALVKRVGDGAAAEEEMGF